MGTVERNTIKRPVQSWMTERAFCFSLALAKLMVSDAVISPDDSEGVVLAKVMKVAKEIRPDDKTAGPLRLGAGRLCDLLADGLGGVGGGWRVLAFLGAGDARRDGRAAGVGGAAGGVQGAGAMVCR